MRTFFLFLIASICCLFHITTVSAKPRADIQLTPKWILARTPDLAKEPKAKHINNGSFLMLYDEQMNVGEQMRYEHVIRKIVNETGVQENARLSVSFMDPYQSVQFHEVTVTRQGKKINKLNPSQIQIINNESELSSDMVNGEYMALIVLEDLRKGDVLDISYSVKGFNPVYGNKYTGMFTFASINAIMNHYTSLLVPAGRKLNHRSYNDAPEPQMMTRGSYTIYDWPVMELEPFDVAGNTPSWYKEGPYVELTEYKNWQEVAQWATTLMNGYEHSIPPALQKKIDEWADTKYTSTFVERATRFVQDDIRYMGIEIGTNSHKPHTPAETFSKRYGDCKDKSLLLSVILRSRNIPAQAVLVGTQLRGHLDEHLPSSALFDHVIVKTEIEGETVYIDPTASMQRGNIYKITCPDYGQVLVINNDTKYPEKIKVPPYGKTEITETYTLPADNKAPGRLVVSSAYEGAPADYMRSYFAGNSLGNVETAYEDYYRKLYTGVKIENTIMHEDDEEANYLTVNENYIIDNLWEKRNERDYFALAAKPIYERMTDPVENAPGKPLYLSYPADIKYTAILEMPSDWSLADEEYQILRRAYSFSFKPEIQGNTIILEYHFQTFQDHIPVEDLAQYKKDYERMYASLSYDMSFDSKLVSKIEGIKEKGGAASVHWVNVFICLLCSAGVFFLFWQVNKSGSSLTASGQQPLRFNWWLVVLGIILVVRIFSYMYGLSEGEFFDVAPWLNLSNSGNTAVQLYFILQMIFTSGFIIYSCWLTYWFVRKRDIFPKMFNIYALGELAINVLYLIMAYALQGDNDGEVFATGYMAMLTKAAGRSIVFVAIWVSAIHSSYYPKSVFIRPYAADDADEPEGVADDAYMPAEARFSNTTYNNSTPANDTE